MRVLTCSRNSSVSTSSGTLVARVEAGMLVGPPRVTGGAIHVPCSLIKDLRMSEYRFPAIGVVRKYE